MPQASAKSNTVQPDKPNEPIFTPRFIAGFAVNFILYMQYYALMVAMAGYSAMQFAAGATEGGFTASVFILGALCSRLFFGGVIDKVGRGRVLVACMTGEVACTLLYLAFEHVPAIGVFIVLRFLHGAFYGLSQTTVTSIVSSAVPFSRKGEGVGYYMLSVTLGAALGPLMGSAFSNAGDFDMLFFSCLGMIAVGYVAALGVVLPGRRQCSEVSKATGATGAAHSVNTAEAPVAAEKAGASEQSGDADKPAKTHKLSLANFIEVRALPVSVAITVGYLAYGALITYINPYAAEVGLTGAASFFFVSYSIAMFVTRPFTGRWFDSAGDKGIMTLGFACLGACWRRCWLGAAQWPRACHASLSRRSSHRREFHLFRVARRGHWAVPLLGWLDCARIRLSRAVPRHGACGGGELRRVHGVPSSWPYCGEEEIARFLAVAIAWSEVGCVC